MQAETQPTTSPGEAGPRTRNRHGGEDLRCADCGERADVPFRPRRNRPVYCKSCHQARKVLQGSPPPSAARRNGSGHKRANGTRPRLMEVDGPAGPPLAPRRGLGRPGEYE